jgi:hypothetical protein
MLLEILHLGPTAQAQPKICENTYGMENFTYSGLFGQATYIRLVPVVWTDFCLLNHVMAALLVHSEQQRSSRHLVSHVIITQIFYSPNSL